MVVVDQIETASCRYSMELVIGKQFTEMFARGAASAIKLIVGVVHLIAAHHGFEPLIEGLPLVAHNSPFDEGCLKEVFKVYQMDYPDYTFYDTCAASRRHFGHRLPDHQLQTVAAACGYDLKNHHHALADAEACAAIALLIL